jgi:hypothetical protein
VWIVPLWSWYHGSWDREPDVPGSMPIEKVMLDFHVCSWTSVPGLQASGDDSLAAHFDALNDSHGGFTATLQTIEAERAAAAAAGTPPPPVISFSHFLPDQRLLPEKRWLHYPNLAKACGSDYIAARIAALHPDAHVYGHTHFTQDQVIEGVRYVQWPLGYPHEQRRRSSLAGLTEWRPIELWDTAVGAAGRQRNSYWSDFYRKNERRPEVVTPAPWVSG